METAVQHTTDAGANEPSALRELAASETNAFWQAAAAARDDMWGRLHEHVSGLATRLLDAAALETEQAVQHVRAEGVRQLDDAHRQVDALNRQLEEIRHQVAGTAEQLERERGERRRVEAERDEQARQGEQVARESDARLQGALREREAAQAEVARLSAALDAERTAHERLRNAVQAVQQIVFESGSPAAKADAPVLQLITTAKSTPAEAPAPAAAVKSQDQQYVEELLDHIQSIYDSDAAIGRPATELVDKLTKNLAYAANAFSRRVGAAPAARALFAQELTVRLDRPYQNAFGRHLAMATYEYEQSRTNGAVSRRNAS